MESSILVEFILDHSNLEGTITSIAFSGYYRKRSLGVCLLFSSSIIFIMVLISFSNIIVDDFSYAKRNPLKRYIYFLTHMHSDHY